MKALVPSACPGLTTTTLSKGRVVSLLLTGEAFPRLTRLGTNIPFSTALTFLTQQLALLSENAKNGRSNMEWFHSSPTEQCPPASQLSFTTGPTNASSVRSCNLIFPRALVLIHTTTGDLQSNIRQCVNAYEIWHVTGFPSHIDANYEMHFYVTLFDFSANTKEHALV